MDIENEVLSNLQKFMNSTLPNALEQRMAQACIMVEADARENCPVDDGQLRQSITHDVKHEADGIAGYVGTDVEYAPYVHEGTGLFAEKGDGRQDVPWKYQDAEGKWHSTKGQKPNPFLKDAIDVNKEKLLSKFTDLF